MRLVIFIILYFVIVPNGYSQYFSVNGKVSAKNGDNIENAHVLVKGSSNGVYTDKKGTYTIKVKQGDTLLFSYIGMRTIEFFIKKEITILDVELLAQEELLDSVLIKKRKGYSQKELLAEYHQNKTIIKTSLGIISKDRASFPIRIIDGENLIPIGTDFLYSLQSLYHTMKVIRDDPKEPGVPKVYLQNWSYNSHPTAIFDVDGVIYEQAPTFLSVSDIDRVAILIRNGAVARYGTAGIGGVIIINTKSGNIVANSNIRRSYDNSKLRDSLHHVINSPSISDREELFYIKNLSESKSEFLAQQLYEKEKGDYINSPYYFIDASDYFLNKWKNKQKALEILIFVTKQFPTNISVLRAVAFKFEELNKLEHALKVNSIILSLNPKDLQSYFNMARTHSKLKKYKRALNGYVNYESIIKGNDSINTLEVTSIITTEIANIIKLHSSKLAIPNTVKKNIKEPPKTRLLFEWNNNQAEFEIRIVDAEKKHYNWKQSKSTSNNVKQLFFDDTFKGNKRVQIIYHGNELEIPTYLKLTAYFNYGKRSQKSESKTFRFSEEGRIIQLLTFNANKIL